VDFIEILKNAVHLPTLAITAFIVQVILLPIRYKFVGNGEGKIVKRAKLAVYTPAIALPLGVGFGALSSFVFPDVGVKLGMFSGGAAVAVLAFAFDLGAGLIKGRKTK